MIIRTIFSENSSFANKMPVISSELATTSRYYSFIIKCNPNLEVVEWIKKNAALLKLKVNIDELIAGPHLTLLYVGNDITFNEICNTKLSKLKEKVNEILNKYDMQSPLLIDCFGVLSKMTLPVIFTISSF